MKEGNNMDNETNYDVSIIFVNYKTSNLVFNVIDSIKEKSSGFSYEIIVVDNSQDRNEYNNLQKLSSDNIHIIDAKDNLGFGKANNLGAKIAKGHYLYFLNTDTLLINNAIYELKNYLDNNDNVGVVGSNLYTKDLKPNCSFNPYEKNVHSDKKGTSLLTLSKKYIFNRSIDFNYTDKPKKIGGYVIGASLMIRKDIFDKLGGFDKDIFMYAEESLLCYRVIHECHKEIYNVPSSKIIHFECGSEKGTSLRHCQMSVDGNYIYYKKLFGDKDAIAYFKNQIKSSKRRKFIFKLMRKKEKIQQCEYEIEVCTNKIKEIKENLSK